MPAAVPSLPAGRGRELEPGHSAATNYGMCGRCLSHELLRLDAAERTRATA